MSWREQLTNCVCALRARAQLKTLSSPIAFQTYINDLPKYLLNCEPRMHADDTRLTYTGSSVDNIQFSYLNQDLENVQNWLRANKLTLNMTKTECMLIGARQRLSDLTDSPIIAIDNVQISQVATATWLGVTIDNKFDWSNHIDKLTKKGVSGIGAIKRIRHFFPQAPLHLTYQALTQLHFSYCIVVRGNCGITLQNKVQKLQNRAAHVLTYSYYDADAGYLFQASRIEKSILPAANTKNYNNFYVSAPEY